MNQQTLTETWFGPHFQTLHPQLQALHRQGGVLRGEVNFTYGSGIAGLLGKRIAKRMGVADLTSPSAFRVEIQHTHEAMIWRRIFNDSVVCESAFEPKGSYEDGYWIEKTGAVQVELGVRLTDKAWHWDCRRVLLHGIPLPSIIRPVVRAHKRIEEGIYCFSVEFSHPWLGKLFSYEGKTMMDLQAFCETTV